MRLLRAILVFWCIFYLGFQPLFNLSASADRRLAVARARSRATTQPYGPTLSNRPAARPFATPLTNPLFHPLKPVQNSDPTVELPIFGPKIFRYNGKNGEPSIFNEQISLPSWAIAPFKIVAVTGSNGLAPVGNGSIKLNGVKIISNQQLRKAGSINQSIALNQQNGLKVRLDAGAVQIVILAAAAAPTASEIIPNRAEQNTSISVRVIGNNFLTDVTGASFGPGISIGSGDLGEAALINVASFTEAEADISIDGKAALGPRTVFLGNGKEISSFENGFTVAAKRPPGRANVSVSTFAGSGDAGFIDGEGQQAKFNQPMSLVADQRGGIYVADTGNHAIRFIDASGKVSLFAGNGQAGFADGLGPMATFNSPMGLAIDNQANLYVADSGNHAIRKIDPTGTVTTIAGSGEKGFNDGPARNSSFNTPVGIAVDNIGHVIVADSGNHAIREIDSTGMVTTIAGDGNAGFSDGQARAAEFRSPTGVVVDSKNTIYITDTGNQRIRVIDSRSNVTTLAGDGEFGFFDDRVISARFADPIGIALDRQERPIIIDSFNSLVREIDNSVVKTVAGSGARGSVDGSGDIASFNRPMGVTIDRRGIIYIADSNNNSIRRLQRGNVGPIINEFSPLSGNLGTEVTIRGVGFAETSEIRFGDIATTFQVIDDTRCVATCPANAVTAPITIVTPSGNATSAQPFIIKSDDDFILSSNTPVREIEPGSTALFIIKADLFNGFIGPINLTTRNLPANISANFTPTQLSIGGVTSQLILIADSSLLPGNYQFEVVGTANINGNLVERALPIRVSNINNSNDDRDFVIGASPTRATIAAGKSVTFRINTVSRGGFSGNIALAVDQLPAGATAVFSTPTVTVGESAFLTINTANTMAATSLSFNVTGATNINNLTVARNITLTLDIGNSTGDQDFLILASPDNPILFPGGQINYTIDLRAIGTFRGDISLVADKLPAGITATFAPPTVATGRNGTLTLQADSTVKPGRYLFEVTGQTNIDTNLFSHTIEMAVVVAGTDRETVLNGLVMTSDDNPQPLKNVTLSAVANPAIQVRTDENGRFVIKGLPAVFYQLLLVDGHTADTALDTYPVIIVAAEIIPNQSNDLGYVIYLPKIDTSSITKIEQNADHDQIITNKNIPNIKVVIPAHTTIINLDGSPVPQVSLTRLRSDRSPMPLPKGMQPLDVPELYSIQPGGAVSSKPVQIFYPNLPKADAGTKYSLWLADHDLGVFKVYGSGGVTADGKQVMPDLDPNNPGLRFGLSQFSWQFISLPCIGNSNANAIAITGLSVTPGFDTLAPGQSRQLQVMAFLNNGRYLDVTGFCSFSSTDPTIVAVSRTGLVTALPSNAANICTQVPITAVLQTIPPGIDCSRVSGNTAGTTISLSVGLNLSVSADDNQPFRFDGENLIMFKGARVFFDLSLAAGSRNVDIRDDQGNLVFQGVIGTTITRVPIQPKNQQTVFNINIGRVGCQQSRPIQIFLLPNASLIAKPGPIPVTDPTKPDQPTITMMDLNVKAGFDLTEYTPPISSIELQVRKGDIDKLGDPETVISSCAGSDNCQGVWQKGQVVDLKKVYRAAVVYKFNIANLQPIIAAVAPIQLGGIILDYKRPVKVVRDNSPNKSVCQSGDSFFVKQAIEAQIVIKTQILGKEIKLFDKVMPAGKNILLKAAMISEKIPIGEYPFTIEAFEKDGSNYMEMVKGILIVKDINTSVLPIGHTIVKGVDIADGHLLQAVTDLKIPGQGLSIELTRTYSSMAVFENSPLGPGWNLNFASRLLFNKECKYYLVIGTDGQSQRFSEDLVPQRGYHGQLKRTMDGFDYITKEGVTFSYGAPIVVASDMDPDMEEIAPANLKSISEPNGNAIFISYDASGLITSVADTSKRIVFFKYSNAQLGLSRRIVEVDGPLGMQVLFRYNAVTGNLEEAFRIGQSTNNSGNSRQTSNRIWRYKYANSADDLRISHRLEATTDPNGNISSYIYYSDDELFKGEGLVPPDCEAESCHFVVVPNKVNRIKQIVEPGELATGNRPITDYNYDFSQFPTDKSQIVTIVDPNRNKNIYTLNSDGSPTRIDQPLGATTIINWNKNDIYKDNQVDAEGHLTTYKYDANANLIEQRVFATDPDTKQIRELVINFSYDAKTNKMLSRTEPHFADTPPDKLRVTKFEYDNRGNMLKVINPLKQTFTYKYNDEAIDRIKGKASLVAVTDSRGFNMRFAYDQNNDNFRFPALVIQDINRPSNDDDFMPGGDPLNAINTDNQLVTKSAYDLRNRLVLSTNGYGQRTRYIYDELDRVVEIKVFDKNNRTNNSDIDSEQAIPDAMTSFSYYPHGEILSRSDLRSDGVSLNSIIVLDALNRPVKLIASELRNGNETRLAETGFEYDANSNKTAVLDRRGVKRSIEYDALNRPVAIRVEGPFGGLNNGSNIITRITYDKIGNKLTQSDYHNNIVSFVYDGFNRIIRRILPQRDAQDRLYQESYTYDELGNVLSFTNANGHTTHYQYDELSRLIRIEDAVQRVTTFEYDLNSPSALPIAQRDLTRGLISLSEYDGLNRLKKQTVKLPNIQGGEEQSLIYVTKFEYDDVANSVTSIAPSGVKNVTQFDAFGRVIKTLLDRGNNANLNITTRFKYDKLGNRIAIINGNEMEPLGAITTEFAYDSFNRLSKIAYPLGLTDRFSYDEEGLLLSHTNRNGITKNYSYDNLGRPLATTLEQPISSQLTGQLDPMKPLLEVVKFEYLDDSANTITITDANGVKTERSFDSLDRLTMEIEGVGLTNLQRQREFNYDGLNLVSFTDFHRENKAGNKTTLVYDAVTRLLSVTDASGKPVRIEYRDKDNQAITTDKRGIKQLTQSDALGRIVSATITGVNMPPITVSRNQYNSSSNLVRTIDANDNVTTFDYDSVNRIKSINRGVGSTVASSIRFSYDNLNNLLSIENGHLSRVFTYDSMGQQISSRDGVGRTSFFSYDGVGNLVQSRDPYGNIVSYKYDEVGALLEVEHDFAQSSDGTTSIVERYRYDAVRNRRVDYRPDYNIVRNYDELGRLISLEEHKANLPSTVPFSTTRFEYDANDNLLQLTDPRGQATRFEYDNLQRLISKQFLNVKDEGYGPITQQYRYHYTDNDLLTRVDETRLSFKNSQSSSQNVQYQLNYDGLDRLASETDGFGKTTKFEFYNNGNRKTLIDPLGNRIDYRYDALNRLTDVSSPYGSASYEYYQDDLLKTVFHGGVDKAKVKSSYNYDNAGRVESIEHRNLDSNQIISSVRLRYIDLQNQISLTESQLENEQLETESALFTFGISNRLIKAEYQGKADDQQTIEYKYDKAGNRAGESIASSKPINRPAPQAFKYIYDAQGHLRQVKDGQDKEIARYEYNFKGQRVRQQTANSDIHSTFDDNDLLVEWDGTMQPIANYLSGALLAARSEVNGNSRSTLYYLLNHLGSVSNLVTANGEVAANYSYDAFGALKSLTSINSSANKLSFIGQQYDAETGMYNVGQGTRYLSPTIGRFLQRDLLLGEIDNPLSLNRYTYAFNNPVRFVDPTGLQSEGDQSDGGGTTKKELMPVTDVDVFFDAEKGNEKDDVDIYGFPDGSAGTGNGPGLSGGVPSGFPGGTLGGPAGGVGGQQTPGGANGGSNQYSSGSGTGVSATDGTYNQPSITDPTDGATPGLGIPLGGGGLGSPLPPVPDIGLMVGDLPSNGANVPFPTAGNLSPPPSPTRIGTDFAPGGITVANGVANSGAVNLLRNPFGNTSSQSLAFLNGLSNTLSDLLLLDTIAEGTYIAADPNREATERLIAAGKALGAAALDLGGGEVIAKPISKLVGRGFQIIADSGVFSSKLITLGDLTPNAVAKGANAFGREGATGVEALAGATAAGTTSKASKAAIGSSNNLKGKVFENTVESTVKRRGENSFFRPTGKRQGFDIVALDGNGNVIITEAKLSNSPNLGGFTAIGSKKGLKRNARDLLKNLEKATNLTREDKRIIRETFQQLLKGGKPQNLRVRVVTGKGTVDEYVQTVIRRNIDGISVEFLEFKEFVTGGINRVLPE